MRGSENALGLLSVAAAVALTGCTGTPAAPDVVPAPAAVTARSGDVGGVLTVSGRGNGERLVSVYVTSQNLVFDSVVNGPLPFRGRFQELEMTGPTGLQTQFGPGDPGYLGGRWWVDGNDNGVMDEPSEDGDSYFSCPLLGPGRALE